MDLAARANLLVLGVEAIDAMRAVKAALDPQNIFNSGKYCRRRRTDTHKKGWYSQRPDGARRLSQSWTRLALPPSCFPPPVE
jgi:hypothetical protein